MVLSTWGPKHVCCFPFRLCEVHCSCPAQLVQRIMCTPEGRVLTPGAPGETCTLKKIQCPHPLNQLRSTEHSARSRAWSSQLMSKSSVPISHVMKLRLREAAAKGCVKCHVPGGQPPTLSALLHRLSVLPLAWGAGIAPTSQMRTLRLRAGRDLPEATSLLVVLLVLSALAQWLLGFVVRSVWGLWPGLFLDLVGHS